MLKLKMHVKIRIIGHSIVEKMKNSDYSINLKLEHDSYVATLTSIPGGTIFEKKSIRTHCHNCPEGSEAYLVIIQMGENELSNLGPKIVARNILTFSQENLNIYSHVRRLVIGSLIKRCHSRSKYKIKTQQQEDMYNIDIAACNHRLQKAIRKINNPRLRFKKHKDFDNYKSQYLCNIDSWIDPVHLNKLGKQHLLRSWKGMLLNYITDRTSGII
ncbi:unnamed protein product [Owenia fusiformis]|uniref:Uncharacterized protein n=1 Tax=Owenia fusiformis TaxID=6347 RepID=A0A8S4NQW7_OWEFU|nr:unnamed protein product [Owenia fusiformis]